MTQSWKPGDPVPARTTPYGAKGCRCWLDYEAAPGREGGWMPNAACPYHGLLPRDRQDTGVYRVVGRKGEDYVEPEPERPFTPGAPAGTPEPPPTYVCKIEQKERGVLAAVRRRFRAWRRGIGTLD